MRQANRAIPRMKSQSYKTFSIQQPLSTHFRRGTCEEVGCLAYHNGWRLRIDTMPEELVRTAKTSGRSWRQLVITQGDTEWEAGTYLIFEAGQVCFEASRHRVALDRPQLFIVGRGDWRTFSPRNARQHKTPEDWAEDFAIHSNELQEAIKRG